MIKAMVFIDGSWLYANTPQLSRIYGSSEYRVDFGKLPRVLAEEVSLRLGQFSPAPVDLVRVYLFGSFAHNPDPRDEEAARSHREFYDLLREEHRYEVELYPIPYGGRRLRKEDRDPSDGFEPKEKCVDVALATQMLYLAATRDAYDVGVAVVGDRDFLPMLRRVRELGKRVVLASIQGSCAHELADPLDRARVKDYDVIWLDALLDRLEFKPERHQRKCESPEHRGNPLVWTTLRPRRGHPFYCEECARAFNERRRELSRELSPTLPPTTVSESHGHSNGESAEASNGTNGNGSGTPHGFTPRLSNGHAVAPVVSAPDVPVAPVVTEAPVEDVMLEAFATQTLTGTVTNKRDGEGYAFIRAANGMDYFFHFTDCVPDLEFEDVHRWLQVEFEVKRAPLNGKAGAAMNVRLPKD